jgi:hypothetical protein
MNVETNLVIALLLYIFAGVVVSETMLKKCSETLIFLLGTEVLPSQ